MAASSSPMIIDCHCHAGAGDGLTGPWDTRASLRRYRNRARRAGIQRSVLFAPFHSDYAIANRQVGEIIAAEPERFWGLACIHPVRDRGRAGRLVEAALALGGFTGLKVHRHDGRISREICQTARRLELPVLYDIMGGTAVVEILAAEYPEVPFIIPHLGSFGDDWAAQKIMIYQLQRHANIHTDTSGVRRFDLLQEAYRQAGPAKILFGSDGPWLHPGLELAKVQALGLPPAEEQLILGGNLLRLTAAARRRWPPVKPRPAEF